ncbi:glycosyltransferase family 2 protein [Lewinella sp. IMCC34183]|uniref:glycosyltransferase family 2 protein n=1 Tax=Lewinella sp. IMCC34183 TaxID=2248762 RepID=UPI0013005EB4|nr:glycosyltransferase family A protein [Lewinella sp. IMCC34183]
MLVSIIIPAYNAEPFIERSLQSALAAGAQVPGRWEIIAVDNGSTDRTPALLREAARQHPEVLRVVTCRRRGAPAARNAGVAASSGAWLQFLDSDDTIDADKIARQLALAGEADWVVGAYRHLYPDGTTEDSIPHPDLWHGLFHDFRTGCTHSNLIRKRAVQEVGGWDERLPSNQDTFLWFRLLQADVRTVIDPVIGSYYHHHYGARITGADPAGSTQHRIQMLAAANAWLIDNRPQYWHRHAPFFLGALLRAVRMLATYDLQSASEAYDAYFGRPNEWAIDRPYELVGRYTRLYPYLGFRNLEWTRRKLARILPDRWKRRLKA